MNEPSLTSQESAKHMVHRKVVWFCAVVLVLLHHDFWWWGSRDLVLGFLPITIAYHMMFSLSAAALWVYAITFAWPRELEEWADEADATAPAAGEPSAAEPQRGGER